MPVLTIYETTGDQWKSNIGPSINSISSDAFFAQQDTVTGNLEVINEASKEMAGGLVSDNLPLPAGTKFFGLDIIVDLSAEDFPHLARFENDLKVTFPGGAQANGSCQWNPDKGIWQFGANDGSGWLDTGFTQAIAVGRTKVQLRIQMDGARWGFTGLRVNDGTPFVPAASFQNLVANASGWSAGLHPQIQTESRKEPWILRESYERIRILASDTAIPWTLD